MNYFTPLYFLANRREGSSICVRNIPSLEAMLPNFFFTCTTYSYNRALIRVQVYNSTIFFLGPFWSFNTCGRHTGHQKIPFRKVYSGFVNFLEKIFEFKIVNVYIYILGTNCLFIFCNVFSSKTIILDKKICVNL